jgi:hypothetical protein
MCRPGVIANEHTIYMRNILRIFDAWHESFALISFCLSVAFFIVLTGFLRGWAGLFLGAALACTVAALGNFGANL